jgi:hypothetical protein
MGPLGAQSMKLMDCAKGAFSKCEVVLGCHQGFFLHPSQEKVEIFFFPLKKCNKKKRVHHMEKQRIK